MLSLGSKCEATASARQPHLTFHGCGLIKGVNGAGPVN